MVRRGAAAVTGYGYAAALEDAPLDVDTRRAYASRVRAYLAWLDSAAIDGPDPLTDAHGRDFAGRDYRSWLKTTAKRATPPPGTTHGW
jgi:integrase/recombinase XerC